MDATLPGPVAAPGARTAPHDLRAHLAELERQEKLVRVRRAINKDTEMHPLVRWQFRGLLEPERRAFLFEQVTDQRGRQFDIPVTVGALAGSEEIYALGLGCSPADVPSYWERALADLGGR